MRKHLVLLFLTSVFVGGSVHGQFVTPRHGKWEASFFGGASFISDGTFLTPVQGGGPSRLVGLDFESGYVLGARVSENLGDHAGAELEYAFSNHPMTIHDVSPTIPLVDLGQKVHRLSYSILVFPWDRTHRIRPFGSFGAGASFFQLESSSETLAASQGVDVRGRWKFAVSYGGGVKVHLKDQWGVRFDIRDQVTGVPDYGLPHASPVFTGGIIGPGLQPDGMLHNWQISAGVIYYWSR